MLDLRALDTSITVAPKRIAFIDHSFHLRTGSSSFFLSSLKRQYDVQLYSDDSWKGGAGIDYDALNRNDNSAVIFFQMVPDPVVLSQIECRNVIVVPMYDSAPRLPFEWAPIAQCKFVTFCKILHETLVCRGARSFYCQFFPNPEDYPVIKESDSTARAFFWQRNDDISWDTIRALIGSPENISGIHLHLAPDPGFNKLSLDDNDIRKYNVKFSDWFASSSQYFEASKECMIYFAPRLKEGVGLSFLEAMARGACVIAPDSPTINEYITDGENGLLFDILHPKAIDLSRVHLIGKSAKEFVRNGYRKWKQQEGELLEFIEGRHKLSKESGTKYALRGFALLLYYLNITIKVSLSMLRRSSNQH